MNTIALQSHGNDAELATMARNLGTTAGRLLPTLRRLEKAGWLTLDERSLTFVYPTRAALQEHGHVAHREAGAILNRLRKPAASLRQCALGNQAP
jgi:hypothetical protein